MEYPNWANPKTQNTDWWLIGAGGKGKMGSDCLMGMRFPLGVMKRF